MAEPTARRPSGGARRGALVGGAGVVATAVVGGVWGATAFFGTGDQAAEVLPADTVAYLGIDLDPSGEQKLEALRTLEKFPSLTEEADALGAGTDVTELLVVAAMEQSGCEGIDYEDDIAPWLGDRMGVAAVPGANGLGMVGVVEVTDEEAAAEGLRTSCDGDGSTSADTWIVSDGWAVSASDEATTQQVLDAASEGSLADDADFTRWTEAAGGPGVLSAYVAPGAPRVLIEEEDDPGLGTPGMQSYLASLEDFDGGALTLRFADAGLEVQAALAGGDGLGYLGTNLVGSAAVGSGVAEVVAPLPADTAALLGVDLEPGWVGMFLDHVTEVTGVPRERLVRAAEQNTGMTLPDDLERAFGRGAAVAISPDADVEGLMDGSTPPRRAGTGLRILTDDPPRRDLVARMRVPMPGGGVMGATAGSRSLVLSPDPRYRRELAPDGDLGSERRFTEVLPMLHRSGAVGFVDLDVLDDHRGLVDALGVDPRVAENLEPLSALGLSAWAEDGATHLMLRISTD